MRRNLPSPESWVTPLLLTSFYQEKKEKKRKVEEEPEAEVEEKKEKKAKKAKKEASEEEAEEAEEEAPAMKVHAKAPETPKAAGNGAGTTCEVFCGNLSWQIDEASLQEAMKVLIGFTSQ